MKKFGKMIAVTLACVIAVGTFASCKDKDKEKETIGTVNGVTISDGVFLNNFSTEMYEATLDDSIDIDFTNLEGEKLYNEVKNKKKDGKSYYDIFIDQALEETRKFMIQYQVLSSKDEWPSESDISDIESKIKSNLDQMLAYYGTTFEASTVQEFAQKAYGMTYDNLVDYFVLTGTLDQYKAALLEKVSVSDEDLEAFYSANPDDYKSVTVRHSLLLTEKMDDDEKAEVLAHAEELVKKYNDGEITFDDIMEESEDVNSSTGKPNNDGYYSVQKDSGFVKNFEEWALSRTEPSDDIEIVETEYGYHIMICTEIKGIEDESVKSAVETGYRIETVENQTAKETEGYFDNKDYEIKNLNRAYVDKIAKRTFTGDFSDVEDSTSGSSASPATPTPVPEYNDEEADATVIAKFGDQSVLKAYFVQFFSQGMNEALEGYDLSDAGSTDKELYEALNKAVLEEYKDGKTRLEYAKERGLELLTSFLATKKMAEEAGKTLSDKDKASLLEELDYNIDMMLQYYGASYKVSTRDELIKMMMSVNVNDYKNIYLDQTFVSDYANGVISDMKPKDEDLAAFFEEHKGDYKIVTIRRISRSIKNTDGKLMTEEEQADILGLLELLKTKYENGDSSEAIAVGYSQASDVISTNGLVDLLETSASVPKEVVDWAFKQTDLGAAVIIKTDSSYEFVIIEGFTDYLETKGIVANKDYVNAEVIQSQLESAYKNEAFDASVQKYIKDNGLALTNIDESVVDAVVKDYLTYKGDAEE